MCAGCDWVGPPFSKISAFKGAHADDYSLRPLPPGSCPCNESLLALAFPDEPPRPSCESVSVSYGVPALPWNPAHMKLYVYLLRVESVFPPVLWSTCAQALLAFSAKFSGGSYSQSQISRLRNLMYDLELFLLWESPCDIVIFQFVGCPFSGYGIAYIRKVPLLLCHCGFFFVFGCRISFFFLAACGLFYIFTVCDFAVFMSRGEVESSTLPFLFGIQKCPVSRPFPTELSSAQSLWPSLLW